MLTAHDVHEAAFGRPPIGKRGYHEDEVDAFLEDVEESLAGHGDLTADDVRGVRFGKPPWGRRGYNEDEVDALLERIAATLDATGTR